MPKVLHVIEDLECGGHAEQLRLVASATRAAGESVAVASLRRPGPVAAPLCAAGVPVEWLGWRSAVDPYAAVRLRRLARRLRVDAVQTWDAASDRAVRWSRAGRGKAVWAAVDRGGAAGPRRRLAGADLVFGPYEAADGAASAAGRLVRTPNAVDPTIAGAHTDRAAARERLRAGGIRLGDDAVVILAVARQESPEAVRQLAWAADLIRVVNPAIRLLIAGGGRGSAAAQRFAAAATEPGLVSWLGPWPDLRDLYAAADVAWCSGSGGPQSTPALEACLAGLPLVVAGAAAAPIDGIIVADLADRAGWARATLAALKSPRTAPPAAALADHAPDVVAKRQVEGIAEAMSRPRC
ncbi:glycosyltransferase [Botrimarina sp.]|uniref:glycosyltransferase n=1 Tax=Botrimarina sp. TaxID=2795802 RepID=UPI0032EF89FC